MAPMTSPKTTPVVLHGGTPLGSTSATVTYLYHPDHRNSHPKKSQWTISSVAELHIFSELDPAEVTGDYAWNIFVLNKSIQPIGISHDRNRRLVLAVFNGGPAVGDTWHGYPGDIRRRIQDSPDVATRLKWIKHEKITPIDLKKLLLGALKC
jgi:hypothetical protein